jgi:hypothetical protein
MGGVRPLEHFVQPNKGAPGAVPPPTPPHTHILRKKMKEGESEVEEE